MYTDYEIIIAITLSALVDAVMAEIASKDPIGAPFYDPTANRWCQAMGTPA